MSAKAVPKSARTPLLTDANSIFGIACAARIPPNGDPTTLKFRQLFLSLIHISEPTRLALI
eukprot:9788711-Alexandrium_andersonii.AAC.1